MEEITADGDSESWALQKSNVARISEQFHAQEEECNGHSFDTLPEAIVCAQKYYERLATFLVRVYKIPVGKKNAGFPLATDTVLNYLGTAINRAINKWRGIGTLATKEFAFCLDIKSSAESAVWLRKLKKRITRICFERAKENGEQMDNSESALALTCCARAAPRTVYRPPQPLPHDVTPPSATGALQSRRSSTSTTCTSRRVPSTPTLCRRWPRCRASGASWAACTRRSPACSTS